MDSKELINAVNLIVKENESNKNQKKDDNSQNKIKNYLN